MQQLIDYNENGDDDDGGNGVAAATNSLTDNSKPTHIVYI